MADLFSRIFCGEEGFFRFDQPHLQCDHGCLPAIALAQARRAGKAAPTVSNQYSITPALQHSNPKVLFVNSVIKIFHKAPMRRAITRRIISEVPSPISRSFWSR
jgi:hypothetical protein